MTKSNLQHFLNTYISNFIYIKFNNTPFFLCFEFLNTILFSCISFLFLLCFVLLIKDMTPRCSDSKFGLYRFDIILGGWVVLVLFQRMVRTACSMDGYYGNHRASRTARITSRDSLAAIPVIGEVASVDGSNPAVMSSIGPRGVTQSQGCTTLYIILGADNYWKSHGVFSQIILQPHTEKRERTAPRRQITYT